MEVGGAGGGYTSEKLNRTNMKQWHHCTFAFAAPRAVGIVFPSDRQGRIQRLGVTHLEVKMVCGLNGGSVTVPIRVLASNPTGYAVRVETYYEVRRGRICMSSFFLTACFLTHALHTSGRAMVAGVVPYPPPVHAFIFIASRVQQYPCLSSVVDYIANSRSRAFDDRERFRRGQTGCSAPWTAKMERVAGGRTEECGKGGTNRKSPRLTRSPCPSRTRGFSLR